MPTAWSASSFVAMTDTLTATSLLSCEYAQHENATSKVAGINEQLPLVVKNWSNQSRQSALGSKACLCRPKITAQVSWGSQVAVERPIVHSARDRRFRFGISAYQQFPKLTLGEAEVVDAGSGHADASAASRLSSNGLDTSNLNEARAEQGIRFWARESCFQPGAI